MPGSAAAAPAAAGSLRLVDNGTSDYVVVVNKDAGPSEKWAAAELAAHLKQMSGAELKVVEATEAPAKAVVLGFGPAAQAAGLQNDESLGSQGFVIRTVGQRLVIAGGRQAGTMYGVFTLLEKLGCRWWTPKESDIPHRSTIDLPTMDLREVPRLEYREMMFGELFDTESWAIWAARNRVCGVSRSQVPEGLEKYGRYEIEGRLHNRIAPRDLEAAGLAVTDEMAALIDGTRNKADLCLTSPATVRAVAEYVTKKLRAKPGLEFVAITPAAVKCTCENCQKSSQQEGPSGLVVQYANQVAELARKDVPRGRVLIGPSLEVPKTLRPGPGVLIYLQNTDGCDYGRPVPASQDPATQRYRQAIERWAAMELNATFLTPEAIAEGEACFREAERAVAGQAEFEKRLRHAHLPLMRVIAQRGPTSPTWKAVEAKAGKIDLVKLAGDLSRAIEEYQATEDRDGAPSVVSMAYWTAWLRDYAAQVAEKGVPMPPELQASPRGSVRVIQACAMETHGRLWRKMAGASDGWVLECFTSDTFFRQPKMTRYYLSPSDDLVPRKRYKLFVRLQGTERTGEGVACRCGVESSLEGVSLLKGIPAADLSADGFRVVEVGEVEMPGPDPDAFIWFDVPPKAAMAKVFLDCLWLQEVPNAR